MKKTVIFLGLFCLFFLPFHLYSYAAESDEEILKTAARRGLKFKLPEDWPIEKKGNSYGPVPIEEYIGMKFEKLEKRMEALETEVENLKGNIEISDERNKKGKTRLSSKEEEIPTDE